MYHTSTAKLKGIFILKSIYFNDNTYTTYDAPSEYIIVMLWSKLSMKMSTNKAIIMIILSKVISLFYSCQNTAGNFELFVKLFDCDLFNWENNIFAIRNATQIKFKIKQIIKHFIRNYILNYHATNWRILKIFYVHSRSR